MSAKHSDRTYVEHGIAPPRPPEYGDEPPKAPSFGTFSTMSASRMDMWLKYARDIQRSVYRCSNTPHLHAQLMYNEHRFVALPDKERVEDLRARAAVPAQWISCNDGILKEEQRDFTPLEQICQECGEDDDDLATYAGRPNFYRLYGTMIFVCCDCYDKVIKRGKELHCLPAEPHDVWEIREAYDNAV